MINVAIIGTGAISDIHIQAFQTFPDRCRVIALVDQDQKLALQKAERYDLDAAIFGSWQDMLDEISVDLAVICLPPFIHAAATVDLLDAGVNVLLEKPMAPTLAECDMILAAAERSGKLLSVVAQNRFKTPMMKLKQVLDSGMIGKILHAQVDSYWWRAASYYDLWWRGTWEKEGGGCTLNHAVHHIDLFQWMMGKPAEVQAVVANLNHGNSEVEDFSTTVVRYADGRLGQLTASLVHHGEEQRFAVQGERASVSAPWRVFASTPRDNGFFDPDPVLTAEIDDFYASLPDVKYDGHVGQIDVRDRCRVVQFKIYIEGLPGLPRVGI